MINLNLLSVAVFFAKAFGIIWAIGLVPVMIYSFVLDSKDRKHGKRQCPYCATDISIKATACPACRRSISSKTPKGTRILLGYGVVFVVFMIIVYTTILK